MFSTNTLSNSIFQQPKPSPTLHPLPHPFPNQASSPLFPPPWLPPPHVSLCASLILQYASFGNPINSILLFQHSVAYSRSAFLSNTLIRANSIAGVFDGFGTYNAMGREVHGVAFKLGFDGDVFVGNTLLSIYGNCGLFGDAMKVFDEIPEGDKVSWNTVIGLCSLHGFYEEALGFLRKMVAVKPGIQPDLVTVASVLPVCAETEDEVMVRIVHCYAMKVGLLGHVKVGNALVDVYGKCGSEKASKKVFDDIDERNVVSWNPIITSFSFRGKYMDALDVFRLMIDVGMGPNFVTISSMLPVLGELGLFKLGAEVHGFSLRMAIESDNRLEYEAVELVRQMQAKGETPNNVTFTNVLPVCARSGFLNVGKEIHAQIIRVGSSLDLFVSNALTKCGCINLAQNVLNISVREEVSYNILIIGYSRTNDSSESLSLFSEMRLLGMRPDIVSFMGVISACANLASIKQGKEVHGLLVRKLFHIHLFAVNSLFDLYTRCGRIDLATKVFDHIQNKDAASWNTMILGYGMQGELNTAINLFEAMKEDSVEYNSVSFIAVLSACSHGGLIGKGRKYFKMMRDLNIEPTHTHYACMVDLLGRADLMEEAADLIRGLSIVLDTNIWGALLGACRIHGNIELGMWAAEHLFELKPQHCGYYILLSNMYAEAVRWDEANKVRKLMKSRGAKKNPGCSWVQIGDQVHKFLEALSKLSRELYC
ncbi:Pentatricopeptide repeat-containing protein [Glycine soja]|uniref:Pentatricopeptide repeat-containing protein n=1 Tax=Glycine soja TaxID=3848 RepID=A0A445F0L6_GLYSO|nr:Pentatricopeptide repeat-containing protein [Glycine soja]